jgi:PleD family two-component response regulator
MTGRLRLGKRVLLVVEDDPDTSGLISMYFAGYDYDVATTARGDEAVGLARQRLPDVVLLDIGLPGMDGYAVCQELRASPRTSYIPVIFLSEKNTLNDRVTGLEAGAQDYVTKPFDLEELRLRVQNLIARTLRDNLVDPLTRLPTGVWLDEQVQRARVQAGWHIVECGIDSFQPFVDQNGFVAGDEVIKFTGRLLRDVVDQYGTADDIVGHPAHGTFLILTRGADPATLAAHVQAQFNEDVLAHYPFSDREQGFMLLRSASGERVPVPLMSMAVRQLPGREAQE